ncbi:Alpha/Beta hydrolase protein [Crepidotus variabilis]|uniref:Alpha/Beta hydrolase protein n=1 Tax=Crepidotus variabilis TaxID=179855 RepID=A0A9P6EL99_9AGAR|nr:Alpha/Beta hydrolase protein [Crepidotus variabilis]
MQTTSYIIPPSDDYPFYITANRYYTLQWEERSQTDSSALTLIILHSTSFHKEIWEPTLTDFIRLTTKAEDTSISEDQSYKRCRTVNVRDIWAIECPNHGASAQLNLRVKSEPDSGNFSCSKYAEAVHRFLSVPPHHPDGPKVDFRKRTLVGVGHSLGANAILLLQSIKPYFDFSFLVIVEPLVTALGLEHLEPLRERLIRRAQKRDLVWESREKATLALSRSAKWDPRVVDVFVQHGLYEEPKLNGYTLYCSPKQEIAMYEDIDGPTKPVEVIQNICHRTPIHLLLGEYADFVPAHLHQALIDPSSGRHFASVTTMKNSGHLIPQQKPTELAKWLLDVLLKQTAQSTAPPAGSPRHRL